MPSEIDRRDFGLVEGFFCFVLFWFFLFCFFTMVKLSFYYVILFQTVYMKYLHNSFINSDNPFLAM